MTQDTLAKLIAVDRRTISNWENSTREPDLATFAKLAEILNTSADYLLGLE